MTIDPEPPRTIAYFSMEIGLEPKIPTYAGGLGVLAGDTLRAAADLGLPMVAITLLYKQGFFRQSLDAQGHQTESESIWDPSQSLEPLDAQVEMQIEGRRVVIGAWRYTFQGITGGTVPLYLLDADLPENDVADRALTGQLYGGDDRYRLRQEVLLGRGGVYMLRKLGHQEIQTFHMNEGHSALLTVGLLDEVAGGPGNDASSEVNLEAVRNRCVFTTHTPVVAGHDRFPMEMVREVVGGSLPQAIEDGPCCAGETLDMTQLGLFLSRYVNGVALSHRETAQGLFPAYRVNSITNGVHAVTWVSQPFADLFDREIPQWRLDRHYLRHASVLPIAAIQEAHLEAKQALLGEVEEMTGVRLDPSVLTIGFGRRAVVYKRPDLIFSDIEALKMIVRKVGPLQMIFAGKAQPQDEPGKETIQRVFAARDALRDIVSVVYLENYNTDLAKLLCSGVDLWLNNPQRPEEASGTSGMKAALNGVPSLSILDGWWVEGWFEGVTGWSIGENVEENDRDAEAASLLNKLAYVIMPCFYDSPAAYAQVMRSAIAINGSFFNAQRMMEQYVENAYRFAGSEFEANPTRLPKRPGNGS